MRSSHLERILGRLDNLDSTNLTHLVQRLARERELLETVFNSVQEGILVINPSGLIEYSNLAANQLISLQEKDLGNAVLWKLVPDLARSLKFKEAQLEASVLSREIYITYPEKRFIRLHIIPFDAPSDVGDHNLKFTIILSDITDDKISTEELIESEKTSSIFMLAAGVAHELGNPLNSINIHLQLIQRNLQKIKPSLEVDKISQSLETCRSEVDRLNSIISNFLTAIRPQSPDLRELNVLQVLDEVLSIQGHELENLKIRVEVELAKDIPIVLADGNQVKQVFFNVIKNAVQAMTSGGLIKINAETDDEFLLLRFKDPGEGISQQDLAKIFEPYFSTKEGGHGLGMMIVQRIMRDHGGQVGIDSVEGEGTTVTLQFPLKARRVRMLE